MEPRPHASDTNRPATVAEGRRLHALGDLAAAEAIYRAVLAVVPDDPEALHLLGVLCHQRSDHEDAVRLIRAALAIRPDEAIAHQNLVLPLLALDRLKEAAAAGAAALRLAPENVGAHINAALALTRAGRFAEAADTAEAAVAIDPGAALAWLRLGHVRALEKRHGLAERHFRRALALDPLLDEAASGLGQAHYDLGRYGEAAATWAALAARRPDDRTPRFNLAAALRAAGDHAAALAIWDRDPGAEAVYNAGCSRLALGDWPAGWAGYERRFDVPIEPRPAVAARLPLWDGEPIEGTLILHHEQGLGDTLQFAALAPRVLDRVGRVVLVCQKPIHGLLSASLLARHGDRLVIVPTGSEPTDAEAWLPLLSLPHRLGLEPVDAALPPYLSADPDRVARWSDWLDGVDGGGEGRPLRVGLVWQGNPKAPAERGRSVPLELLAPLGEVAGVTFVSLQKGFGRDQLEVAGWPIADPGPDFDAGPGAFLDTLALCRSLDLVVSVDTSVAHVAAGGGTPVLLLLRHVPDWRWGLSGERAPWYGATRILRQKTSGDWTSVVEELAAHLAAVSRMRASADPDGSAAFAAGLAAHQAGRPAVAFEAYRRRLLVTPLDARATNFAALAALDAGGRTPDAARTAVELALASVVLAPEDPDLAANAAVVLRAAGRAAEAEAILRRALAAHPGHGPTVTNLVNGLVARGAAEEAIRAASGAAAVAPRNPEVLKALGNALRAATQGPEAAAAFRLAVALDPADITARIGLGGALSDMGDHAGARSAYVEILARDPRHADAWSNLGVVEKRISGPALGVWFYRRALDVAPDHVEALANLGSGLVELGRPEEAAAAFRRAIALRPGHPEALMALGMTLLADGRYEEGFSAYEGRVGSARLGLAASAPPVPRWTGDDPRGRAFLLLSEQGFGDAIQFVRYAAALKARGAARVLVGCRKRLAALISSAEGVDGVVAEGGALPPVDAYAHLMSLPHLLGTTLDTVPAAVPYITPDPERVEAWAIRLAERDGFRIGIVWQGNPDPGVDRGRSIPLAALEPLARIPGVRLIALQKGAGSEQVEALADRFAVEALGPGFDEGPDSFLDTAAVMANLDLVVSTDTAALHLAGALGRPTFALLKRHAEWRWLKDRTGSPWYPTLRLFRQNPGEDEADTPFAGAVARLAAAVERLVAGDRSALLPGEEPVLPPPPPADADTRFGRALDEHRAGRLDRAAAGYAALLVDHPDHAEAVHMLGALALQRLDYPRADLFLREAERLGLATSEFATNRAVALRRLGKPDAAEALLRRVLAERPSAEAHATLGGLLADAGRFEDALEHLAASVAEKPDVTATLRTYGNTLRDAGRLDEALSALDRAVAAAPEDAEARIDRAHARLMAGDWRGGFADYRWRWRGLELQPRAVSAPEWDGRELAGSLLVYGEQGLGDHIQFARFLAAARARVGGLVFEVRRPLVRLFDSLGVDVTVAEEGAGPGPFEAQIALLSLPDVLGLDAADLGMAAPYLTAEPDRLERWRDRLGVFGGLTVGLAWQGNPSARADKGRSPPLAALAPMVDVPGTRFVALQKEHGLDQLGSFDGRIVHPGADFDAGPDAFLDSAAILSLCDLVVTSDTALAHLSGALARPTWTMLKHVPDWRWGLSGHETLWYSSMRLFRQTARGDWPGVGGRLAAALRDLSAAR